MTGALVYHLTWCWTLSICCGGTGGASSAYEGLDQMSEYVRPPPPPMGSVAHVGNLFSRAGTIGTTACPELIRSECYATCRVSYLKDVILYMYDTDVSVYCRCSYHPAGDTGCRALMLKNHVPISSHILFPTS